MTSCPANNPLPTTESVTLADIRRRSSNIVAVEHLPKYRFGKLSNIRWRSWPNSAADPESEIIYRFCKFFPDMVKIPDTVILANFA